MADRVEKIAAGIAAYAPGQLWGICPEYTGSTSWGVWEFLGDGIAEYYRTALGGYMYGPVVIPWPQLPEQAVFLGYVRAQTESGEETKT